VTSPGFSSPTGNSISACSNTAATNAFGALVAALRDQTRLSGLKQLADTGQLDEAAAEHEQILDAVKRRDAEQAKELMRRHLRHTRGIWAGHAEDADLSGSATT